MGKIAKTSTGNQKTLVSSKPKLNKVLKQKTKPIRVVPKVVSNLSKRKFDPLRANRGIVQLRNIPHGFYEDSMFKYFSQFGSVTRVRVVRSEKTGRSKCVGYVEFKVPEVAQIASETMNNYMMFNKVLKTTYIPPEEQNRNYFRKDVQITIDSNGVQTFSSRKTKHLEKVIKQINETPTDEQHKIRQKRSMAKLKKQQEKYSKFCKDLDLSSVVYNGKSTEEVIVSTDKKKGKMENGKKEKKKNKHDSETENVPRKKIKKEVTSKNEYEDKTSLSRLLNETIESSDSSDEDFEIEENEEGEESLAKLLNETITTDSDDDTFRIDHSFSASDDDSDNENASDRDTLIQMMKSKLDKIYYDGKSNESNESNNKKTEKENFKSKSLSVNKQDNGKSVSKNKIETKNLKKKSKTTFKVEEIDETDFKEAKNGSDKKNAKKKTQKTAVAEPVLEEFSKKKKQTNKTTQESIPENTKIKNKKNKKEIANLKQNDDEKNRVNVNNQKPIKDKPKTAGNPALLQKSEKIAQLKSKKIAQLKSKKK